MRSPAIFVQSVCCPCPTLYSSLPVPCRGRFTPPSWVSLLCDLSVPSALSVNSPPCFLLSARRYLLSPSNQPIFLPPKKNGGSSRPRRLLDPNSYQALFFTSDAFGPLGPCTMSNSTGSPSCNVR